MAIFAHLATMTGIRRTVALEVHDVSVDVDYTDNELGIDRVEFAISVNGVLTETRTVTQQTVRRPNFTNQPSRTFGVGPNDGLAPFPGYGIDLICSNYTGGTITIVITVYSNAGNSYVVPKTLTVYNDTDGADRRPAPRTVYIDFDNGSDTNNGSSFAQGFKTRSRALFAILNGGNDSGGGIIYCRGLCIGGKGTTGGFGNGFIQHQTSGAWWLQWIADPVQGCTLSSDPAANQYDKYFTSGGFNTQCNQRFTGFDWSSNDMACYNYNGTSNFWFDGGRMIGTSYLGENQFHVNYAGKGGQGAFIGFDGTVSTCRRHFTGVAAYGSSLGFEVAETLYDCLCQDFIGIGAKTGETAPVYWISHFWMINQLYRPRYVQGYVAMGTTDANGEGFPSGSQPAPAFTVTKPDSNTVRITGPTNGYDFNVDAAGLVGETRWGVRLVGAWPSGCAGFWLVTNTGRTSNQSWIEIYCPGGTTGSTTANSATFATADGNTASAYYWQRVHPDGIQFERDGFRDACKRVTTTNCEGMQSYFFSGGRPQSYCVFKDLRDDGRGENVTNWFGASVTNSLIENMNINGQWQVTGSSWSGTCIRNNVFGSTGGQPDQLVAKGATARYNHFITGPTFGTNASTGSWYKNDHTSSPYSFEPLDALKGNGTPDISVIEEFSWNGNESTKGNTKLTAILNYLINPEIGKGGHSEFAIRIPAIAAQAIAKKGGTSGINLLKPVAATVAIGRRQGSSVINALKPSVTTSAIGRRQGSSSIQIAVPAVASTAIFRRTGSSSLSIPQASFLSLRGLVIPQQNGIGEFTLFVPTAATMAEAVKVGQSSIDIKIPVIFAYGQGNILGQGSFALSLSELSLQMMSTGIKGLTGSASVDIHIPVLEATSNKNVDGTVGINLPIPFIISTAVGTVQGSSQFSLFAPQINASAKFVHSAVSAIGLLIPEMVATVINSKFNQTVVAANVKTSTAFRSEVKQEQFVGKVNIVVDIKAK